MKNYAVLRLLLAALMLYFAWPYFALGSMSTLATILWAIWAVLFLLVVGSNLANLMQMIAPPAMEQDSEKTYMRSND